MEGDSHTGLLAPLEALARELGYRVAYLDHAAVRRGRSPLQGSNGRRARRLSGDSPGVLLAGVVFWGLLSGLLAMLTLVVPRMLAMMEMSDSG